MAATPSVRIVKSSEYRDGVKQFGNRYHFSGGTPADLTHWTTFVDNVVAAEKLAVPNNVNFLEAVCYAAGSDIPVETITLSGAGSQTGGTGAVNGPLEVCALLRWTTDARTAKNHPVYLFSYMRRALRLAGSSYESTDSTYRTAMSTYAAAWVTGFSDGSNTYHRAGPNGAVALAGACEVYVTHRDFPR